LGDAVHEWLVVSLFSGLVFAVLLGVIIIIIIIIAIEFSVGGSSPYTSANKIK